MLGFVRLSPTASEVMWAWLEGRGVDTSGVSDHQLAEAVQRHHPRGLTGWCEDHDITHNTH